MRNFELIDAELKNILTEMGNRSGSLFYSGRAAFTLANPRQMIMGLARLILDDHQRGRRKRMVSEAPLAYRNGYQRLVDAANAVLDGFPVDG